ncbi:hypothetical protein BJ742DRAFT_671978 [Cladochytrium replicatum]|nr:hypothetical protein BJ742DRAFT_671978 [Cladochytrium replicatum]
MFVLLNHRSTIEKWLFRGDIISAIQHEGLRDKAPLVLDFASDTNPGGGWRGNQQGTQEESLCRSSSLGLTLENSDCYPIPWHGAVYVPDVCIVDDESSFWVSVVAAALRPDADEDWIRTKTEGIIKFAVERVYAYVVLGAWGCGAFGNDPGLVAEGFRELLVCTVVDFRWFCLLFSEVIFARLNKFLHRDGMMEAIGKL